MLLHQGTWSKIDNSNWIVVRFSRVKRCLEFIDSMYPDAPRADERARYDFLRRRNVIRLSEDAFTFTRVPRERNCKSSTVLEPRKPALRLRASNWFWQINRNSGLTGASTEIHLLQRGKVVFWLVLSRKKSHGNMIVKSKRIVTRMRSFEWTRISAHSYNMKYYIRDTIINICVCMWAYTYKFYNSYKHLNIYIYIFIRIFDRVLLACHRISVL